jgi:hypothetical protein
MENDRFAQNSLWTLPKDAKLGIFIHCDVNGMPHAYPLTTPNKSVGEIAIRPGIDRCV